MRKKEENDKYWMLTIDEEGTLAGDIEAIRTVFHKSGEMGFSFDMAPYCG